MNHHFLLRFLLIAYVTTHYVFGSIVPETIYINRGYLPTITSTVLPSLAFNSTNVYEAENAVINLGINDTLVLTIMNNDSVTHGFSIKNYPGISELISPGDSVELTLSFGYESVWLFYDHLNYPNNRYMGLGSMICVTNSPFPKYYWNIKEHQTAFNIDIANGIGVNWNTYYPDYFTINGESFPDILNHNLAVPSANLGDTILIFVINSGQSKHSIHFHGFHATAQYAHQVQQVNWEKDTWPLRSMDYYIWRIVFDKPGEYSVHDHNLVAVSGGSVHPNGMFLIMSVFD